MLYFSSVPSRHFLHADIGGCGDTAVTGDDAAVIVDYNRKEKAEFPYAGRNLAALFPIVNSAVIRIGFQFIN